MFRDDAHPAMAQVTEYESDGDTTPFHGFGAFESADETTVARVNSFDEIIQNEPRVVLNRADTHLAMVQAVETESNLMAIAEELPPNSSQTVQRITLASDLYEPNRAPTTMATTGFGPYFGNKISFFYFLKLYDEKY